MSEGKHDFIKSGDEYNKIKQSKNITSDFTPRETPSQQVTGDQGYHKPDFSAWTREEILQYARKLNLSVQDDASIEDLIATINNH